MLERKNLWILSMRHRLSNSSMMTQCFAVDYYLLSHMEYTVRCHALFKMFKQYLIVLTHKSLLTFFWASFSSFSYGFSLPSKILISRFFFMSCLRIPIIDSHGLYSGEYTGENMSSILLFWA